MKPTERTALPTWLEPLVDTIHNIKAEHLAPLFPHAPDGARAAAVLMLFHELDGDPAIVLTERAASMRSHPGQISFPGGRSDSTDTDAVETALRESHEEVGLVGDDVIVVGQLPSLWIPPSNHDVTPVIAYHPGDPNLHVSSPDEVERVLSVRIGDLMDPRHRFSVVHPSGWTGPGFDIGTTVPLWGFTAGIISRLFEKVGWERPWDTNSVIELVDFESGVR